MNALLPHMFPTPNPLGSSAYDRVIGAYAPSGAATHPSQELVQLFGKFMESSSLTVTAPEPTVTTMSAPPFTHSPAQDMQAVPRTEAQASPVPETSAIPESATSTAPESVALSPGPAARMPGIEAQQTLQTQPQTASSPPAASVSPVQESTWTNITPVELFQLQYSLGIWGANSTTGLGISQELQNTLTSLLKQTG